MAEEGFVASCVPGDCVASVVVVVVTSLLRFGCFLGCCEDLLETDALEVEALSFSI